MSLVPFAISAILAAVDPHGASTPDPVCTTQPSACRVVPPFDLRVGDKSYPIRLEGLRPWIADGRLTIFPGESVVLNVETPDKPVVESSGPAAEVVSDERANELAAQFGPGGPMADAPPEATGRLSTRVLPPYPPRTVRVTFRQPTEGHASLLVVENGFENTLRYDAGMLVPRSEGNTWAPTSVCTVRPRVFSFEYWPHPIMAISLGGFAIDPQASTEQVECR